ncbi:hypothetical protein H0H93_001449, partial [Arthromyces matolae]
NPETSALPNVRSYPAMTFNQPVSPCLASHALVHGLIRRKKMDQASRLTMAMMECGMRVRSKTLDILMKSLKPAPSSAQKFVGSIPPRFTPNPTNFNDLPRMAQHPSSQLALEIFVVARRAGQGSMKGLFATLIAICLINTEIVLASLLFATTVKEFYHPPPSPDNDTTEKTWNVEKYGPRSLVFLPQWSDFVNLTAPMKDYFKFTAQLTTTSPQFDQNSLEAHLQALAILANLLDSRQLHLPTISTLLSLMYSTPRLDSEVWVLDANGRPQRVVAYEYFHDVLVRLIESPPDRGGPGSSKKRNCRAFTPPLGLQSCNTLLHYALRHCQSMNLGDKVLVHLTQTRKLTPDETTYNILLRSGTLLRNNDLSSLALEALTSPYKDSKASNHSKTELSSVKYPAQKQVTAQSENRKVPHHSNTKLSSAESPIRILATSQSAVARRVAFLIDTLNSIELWMISRGRTAKIQKAVYALTTHIMHLCSTGRPKLVNIMVHALFPIIGRSSSMPLDQYVNERRKTLVRAAHFGPRIFTVMLNALVKAGLFSQARVLYYLAVRAERRSWFSPSPWAFGVEFYTIVLELCAGECQHASRLERIPAAVAQKKPITVRNHALRMALRVYKRINTVRYVAQNTVQNFGHPPISSKGHIDFPKPDERFATALVKVLILHSKHLDRNKIAKSDIKVKHLHPSPHIQDKISAQSAADTYAHAERDFAERKELPDGWTGQLQFIARGIVQAGMDVPPGLQHLFLGRYDPGARPNRGRGISLKAVPWAYPTERPANAWNPWVVPSIRTRGLLLRRMTKAQRLHGRHHRSRKK